MIRNEQQERNFQLMKDRQNIVRLHEEPAQWEVALDIDIPHHKQHSPEVQALLTSLEDAIQRAVSTEFFAREAKRLGVVIVGLRSERC